MLQLLHIANGSLNTEVWTAGFRDSLSTLGNLTIVENGATLDDAKRMALIQGAEVLLLGWGSASIPPSLAREPGALRYLCNITGEMKAWVPPELVESGLPITNWGDAPAPSVAEGAMTLLLAVLKDLHRQIQTVRRDGWCMDSSKTGGSIEGLNVGIYGCGMIGRLFIELIRPFRPILRVFDPYAAEVPPGCERVSSLETLFSSSEAIVIHAGLNDGTRCTVTADLLRRLPLNGVVINTARGGIIDQEALFAELASGRLRAGLDVLDPDSLPGGHPARNWENCILTAHHVSQGWPKDGKPAMLPRSAHSICLDNLRRFAAGKPLRFLIDPVTYRRQT
ncbi:MAG: NAD(P)-dependent oxidoreductase [bacterium]